MTLTKQPVQFLLLSAGTAVAALYHLTALLSPAFANIAYSLTYPPLRHIVFIAINCTCAYLFLSRPRWFIWIYIVLAAQAVNGHGTRLWRTWFTQNKINWIDIITVSGVLLGLAFLFADLRKRKGEVS